MIIQDNVKDNSVTKKYKSDMKSILSLYFRNLTDDDFENAINYSISKRYKEEPCKLYNNYTNKTADTTLLDITNYIINREPIITAWGVLFKRHGTVPNPLSKMIDSFMKNRKMHKKEMFKYPKYSEDWEKYNLLQLLDKIDCNSIYGILGLFSSLFYNLHVAASITATGKSCVSAMGMFFESFLSNNVKFGSLNEVLTFIDNIRKDKKAYYGNCIIDRDITYEEAFRKVATSIGFEWRPDEKDLDIIRKIIYGCDQETINRLYYKNNLYDFVENAVVINKIKTILSKLNEPFMDPNEVPSEVKTEMDELCDFLRDYVYYQYQIIDRIDRLENMPRNVTLVIDTDSNLVSLDAWYRCILNKVMGDDFQILHYVGDLASDAELDEFGDAKAIPLAEIIPPVLDYDFYSDEVIEMEKSIDIATLQPSDSLRYSIINILSYCLGVFIKDYMKKYTQNSNSYAEDKCMMIAKNEYLFRRILLTNAKKNYASIQELQEGNYLGSVLDTKGLAIDKSSMNESTRKALRNILYEDILKVDTVDQINILKKMAMLQQTVYNSLRSGEKNYYKPITIKSMNSYDDPMGIQGIKASIAWNMVRDDNSPINLEERNSIDIVKVNINYKNIESLRENNFGIYEALKKIVSNPKEQQSSLQKSYKGEINAIAIPKDVPTPAWILDFIDYTTIVNDNLKNMPIESIGIRRQDKSAINYTNIIEL